MIVYGLLIYGKSGVPKYEAVLNSLFKTSTFPPVARIPRTFVSHQDPTTGDRFTGIRKNRLCTGKG